MIISGMARLHYSPRSTCSTERLGEALGSAGNGNTGTHVHENELRCPVNRHKKVEFSFLAANLGDVDVEATYRIGLELLLSRLVALDLGQPTDAVALETAMQGRSGELGERRQ